MRLILFFLSASVFMFIQNASADDAAFQTVLPGVATVVEMNNSDPNHVVCSEPVKDIFVASSERRNIDVQFKGRNGFIKFPTIPAGGKFQFSEDPAELFITCGDDVYHIIAHPRRIPSKTIRLSSGQSQAVQKNIDYFASMPYAEKLLNIIDLMYTQTIPDTFNPVKMNRNIEIFKDIAVRQVLRLDIPGEGLVANEFVVGLRKDAGPIDRIKTKNFIVSDLTTRTAAITIDKHSLKPGDTARLIIVERKESEGASSGR